MSILFNYDQILSMDCSFVNSCMTFAFDLISDLHVETWDNFDWTGQPTSPYCVVAGDVSRDHDRVADTLAHLNECYAGVFYIDGNDEHRYQLEDLAGSYRSLKKKLKKLDNVVYLQDNVVIINGVAILATNGWWSYDFDPSVAYEESQAWYQEYTQSTQTSTDAITGIAYHDATYLTNSIRKLQTHQEVKSIVVVSHTLPGAWLCNHDPDLVDTARFNCMGNPHLQRALDEDTENKIRVWAFGHYHRPVDQDSGGIRYVSNPKGRGNTPWCQSAYYPKRIQVEI
jgi:UDP-2,3-diacylglucosamine pyrophosphatase LpxH